MGYLCGISADPKRERDNLSFRCQMGYERMVKVNI